MGLGGGGNLATETLILGQNVNKNKPTVSC